MVGLRHARGPRGVSEIAKLHQLDQRAQLRTADPTKQLLTPGGIRLRAGQFLNAIPQLGQCPLDALGAGGSRRRGAHAIRAARKQASIEVTFDGRDRLSDRGLRQMHPQRRAR